MNQKVIELLDKFEKEYDEKEKAHYQNGNERASDIAAYKAYICHRLKRRILLSKDAEWYDLLTDMERRYAEMIETDFAQNRAKELQKSHILLLKCCGIICKRLQRLL